MSKSSRLGAKRKGIGAKRTQFPPKLELNAGQLNLNLLTRTTGRVDYGSKRQW